MKKSILLCIAGLLLLIAGWQIAKAAYAATVNIAAVVKYTDGSVIEADKKIVYSIYDCDTDKQITTTFTTTAVKNFDDAVKCIYVRASLYDAEANNAIAGTTSEKSPPWVRPMKPTIKQLAPPLTISVVTQ
jgi:hypothetical protein